MSTNSGLYTVNESELSFRILDGEAVIISSTTGFYYSLNRSGTVLWNLLLDGGQAPAAAAAALASYYEVDPQTAASDVAQAIAALRSESLIVPSAGTTGGAHDGRLPSAPRDHAYEPPQLVKFDKLQRLMVCGE